MYRLLIILLLLTNLSISTAADYTAASNFGNNFTFSIPPNLKIASSSENNFINIVVTSPYDTKVYIQINSKGYLDSIEVKANQTGKFQVLEEVAQVYSKNGFENKPNDILFTNSAIKLSSEMPISVAVLSDFSETSDAFLAIPDKNLGSNYVISGYDDISNPESFSSIPSFVLISSTKDSNKIDFTYGGNTKLINPSRPPRAGETHSKILNAGDTWLLSTRYGEEDLAGSIINSTDPISVITGSQSVNIPVTSTINDYIVNSEVPTKYWGKDYYVSKPLNRDNVPVARIFASNDSTDIFINGELYTQISKAGGIINEGFIEVDDIDDDYFISSNKPINVVIYNQGLVPDKDSLNPGGNFATSLNSLDLMQNEILFTTPNFTENISYPNNHANIIIPYENKNDIPQEFEISTLINGNENWQSVKGSGLIKSAHSITNPYNNTRYAIIKMDLPFASNFKFRNPDGVSALIYGSNEFKSYAYPAGLVLIPNSGIDTIPPLVEWDITCKGDVTGVVIDESQIKNTLFVGDESYNFSFDNFNIDPSFDSPRNWTLKVDNPLEDGKAVIHFWDEYLNKSTVVIEYESQKFSVEPQLFELENVKLGDVVRKPFTINNLSEKNEFYVSQLINSLPDYFKIFHDGNRFFDEVIIQPQESEIFEFEFTAVSIESIENFIKLSNECLEKEIVRIVANISSPRINVSDIDFGNISTGKIHYKNATIFNESNHPLEIDSITFANNVNIISSFQPLAEGTFPIIISPFDRLSFVVEISSESLGPVEDKIVFHSDAFEVDSTCVIYANFILPGIEATNYNFGRKKVVDGEVVTELYESENFYIANESENTVVLDSIVLENIDGKAFSLDSKFEELEIGSGETQLLPIKFKPTKIGEFLARIYFYVNGSRYSLFSKVTGVGTQPYLSVPDIDFGTVVYSNEELTQEISIINNSIDFWDYAEVLEQFELEYDLDLFEDNGISIIKDFHSLLPISPGDSFNLRVSLVPQKPKEVNLALNVNSEAMLAKPFISITANIIDDEIEIELSNNKSTLSACFGSSDITTIILRNHSVVDVEIEPLSFSNNGSKANQGFIIDDSRFTKDFIIPAKEFVEVPIKFTSLGEFIEAHLIVKQKNKINSNEFVFFGQNLRYDAEILNYPEDQLLYLGDISENKVSFNTNFNTEKANITGLSVFVDYPEDLVYLDDKSITKGDLIERDYLIDDFYHDPDEGFFRLNLLSLDEAPLYGVGDLINYKLIPVITDSKSLEGEIITQIESISNNCMIFEQEKETTIELHKSCGIEFRAVELSDNPLQIENIYPNPINSNTIVSVRIPTNSQNELYLISSTGKKVHTLHDGYLKEGKHSFDLNIENLGNGVYFLILNSESGFLNQELIILQ